MADIKYDIVKKIGVLSKAGSGWTKELNLISWNDREPKYDLRDWSADGSKMGKGVTLSKDELLALRDLLNGMELYSYPAALNNFKITPPASPSLHCWR